MGKIEETLATWAGAWERRLDQSRPYWKPDPRFPFLYDRDAAAIAYDPRDVPQHTLGPFLHLRYTPPKEANDLVVTREQILRREPCGNLLHELKNILINDPDDDSLVVIPNRWPRTHQHSLLITRQYIPQQLTLQLIEAQFKWVKRGMVVEFHKFSNILNHFHAHIYLLYQVPLAKANTSFQSTRAFGGVAEGILTQYPVTHIAYFSADMYALQRIVFSLVAHLDENNERFSQVLLEHKAPHNGFVFVCFLPSTDAWVENFAFNVVGFARTEQALTESDAVQKAVTLYRNDAQFHATRNELWSVWQGAVT